MKPSVYLETTIPSYLTARPSRDLILAAHQQVTRAWWDTRRSNFELYISQVVLRECQAGDATAAAERRRALAKLPLLAQTEEVTQLAQALVDHVRLPARAAVDALHVAIASVHGMVLADLELHAHRQRYVARAHRVSVSREWIRSTNDLYA